MSTSSLLLSILPDCVTIVPASSDHANCNLYAFSMCAHIQVKVYALYTLLPTYAMLLRLNEVYCVNTEKSLD